MDAKKKYCFWRSCWHLRREICLSHGKTHIYFFVRSNFAFILFLCLSFKRKIDFTIWLVLLLTIRCGGLPLSHWDSKTNTNHLMVYSTNSFLAWRSHHEKYFAVCKVFLLFSSREKKTATHTLHILIEILFTLFIYLFLEDV